MEKQAGKRNYSGYRPKAGNILKLQSYFSQPKGQVKSNVSMKKFTKSKKS
jgi:hypothetical protein